jgi:hypothetical protein
MPIKTFKCKYCGTVEEYLVEAKDQGATCITCNEWADIRDYMNDKPVCRGETVGGDLFYAPRNQKLPDPEG